MTRTRLWAFKLRVVVGVVALIALTVAASAGANGAFTLTMHTESPESLIRTNTCNGNPISFEGTFKQIVHVTFDPAGGSHGVSNGRWTDLNVIDLVTGQRFRVVGAQAQVTNVFFEGDPPEGSPWSGTNIFTFNFIAPGPGNNIISHTTSHFTINANGEMTADVLSFHLECR